MTDRQLKALQSYVAAVVRVMTKDASAHSQNVRLLLDAKHCLEAAFGELMPVEHDYPDLFADVPTPSGLPDIL